MLIAARITSSCDARGFVLEYDGSSQKIADRKKPPPLDDLRDRNQS
jgi:hypothetical protein